MGKDREGKFHPVKGKPSDTSGEGTELKELMGTDVHVRHPNRQTHKGKEKTKPAEEGSLKTWEDKTYAQNRTDTTAQEIYGVLTKEMLKELAGYRSDCCITIVLPTHRAGMEVNEQQDLILYKNVLQDVKKQLEEKKTDPVKIEKILEPAFELLRNDQFWRNQGKGLAIFIADGYFKYIKLPFTPEQECIVNNTFYLINLVRLLNTNAVDEFYLLLIRRDMTQLFKADAGGVHEVESEDLPCDINSVINFDEEEKEFMQTKEGENTDRPEHVTSGRPDKVIVNTYMEKIDKAFQKEAPPETNWPLMLAGQQELMEAFRKSSQYNNIMSTELLVDDENANSRELFLQAREKLEERMKTEMNERLETYYNSIATNLTSSMPEHVIPATHYSQVRALFVERGAHIWGSFDEQNNKLNMHAEREEGDDCLVEKAAIQTILHGGEVFILEKEKMPKGATIAALLRYAQ
jgi:hypothetical protein